MQFSWPNIDTINVCPPKNGHILAFSNIIVYSSWQDFTWMNKPPWYLKLVLVWNYYILKFTLEDVTVFTSGFIKHYDYYNFF